MNNFLDSQNYQLLLDERLEHQKFPSSLRLSLYLDEGGNMKLWICRFSKKIKFLTSQEKQEFFIWKYYMHISTSTAARHTYMIPIEMKRFSKQTVKWKIPATLWLLWRLATRQDRPTWRLPVKNLSFCHAFLSEVKRTRYLLRRIFLYFRYSLTIALFGLPEPPTNSHCATPLQWHWGWLLYFAIT